MKFIVLAAENMSDHDVDKYLRGNFGIHVHDECDYTVIRNREGWEAIQGSKFGFWTQVGVVEPWTRLRVVEKFGMPLEQQLMRDFFMRHGAGGSTPAAPLPLSTH